ncbi:hypothetical protein SORBI_3009G047900 [Sorghum bicolor]|uniref:RING-type E3 ubiquitin transferase n=1 Tax=Sorghum bicolor TaxID=4558 RepID=C5Z074_SORBI|nr:hypothetical protein SORBI_3009G047900 [Sorghum bicolor]
MGDVRRPILYSSQRRWRTWSSVAERGESSLSRKRARSRPPPPRLPLRYYYSDDVVVDDGSHGRSHDDDYGEEEEDEEQIRTEDDRYPSRGNVSSGADDAAEAGGAVEEQLPPEDEDSGDDDRPLSSVVARAHTLVHRRSISTAPASMPAPAPPESSPTSSSSSDSSSVIKNVTVENSSAFDCSICYLPLKSPIFQCPVGHVVCSPCHDKLRQATNCHVCRVPIPGGYFRCNAMEKVVDSIRVPCPHAAHGCAERMAYHDRDGHARTCAHKPCHCPGEGCGFSGSVQTTLLEHFAAVHGWPCSAGTATGMSGFVVSLRKGFNVVVVTAGADDCGTTTTTTEQQYTLVLNVEQAAPVCNTITAFCIHPSHTGTVTVRLSYYRWYRWWRLDSDCCHRRQYAQSSQLDVVCTDLSNGMPGPSSCFPLLVPRWSSPGGEDDEDIRVTVNYIRGN